MEINHIGDGIYVGFDGYHITIAVNDHRNIVAYFEPEVMINLINYWNQLIERVKKEKEDVQIKK